MSKITCVPIKYFFANGSVNRTSVKRPQGTIFKYCTLCTIYIIIIIIIIIASVRFIIEDKHLVKWMLWINTTKLCSTMLTQDAFLSKIKS